MSILPLAIKKKKLFSLITLCICIVYYIYEGIGIHTLLSRYLNKVFVYTNMYMHNHVTFIYSAGFLILINTRLFLLKFLDYTSNNPNFDRTLFRESRLWEDKVPK